MRTGDESLIDAFLTQHADSSLFLRSFLTRGGLVDEGKPLQGTYAIALEGEQVAGVVMHSWNGNMYLQAPEDATRRVNTAVQATGRPLIALGGPWLQVMAGTPGIGCSRSATALPRGLICSKHFRPYRS